MCWARIFDGITIASTEVGLARFYQWTINSPDSVMRVVTPQDRMGLEFQSRGFLYLRDGDTIADDLDGFHFNWWHTGANDEFRHFCADAKSHSFAAAHQVSHQSSDLRNSIGFFSLSADFGDVGPGFDRGYLLFDEFREINARSSFELALFPPALFNHFQLCFHVQYDSASADRFIAEKNPPAYRTPVDAHLPISGWFFNHKPLPEFEAGAADFFNPESVVFASSSSYDDQYLFFGDTADVNSTVSSMQECSARFATTVGLAFLIHSTSLQQLLFFGGNVYELGHITPADVQFHEDIQFSTGHFGYKKR